MHRPYDTTFRPDRRQFLLASSGWFPFFHGRTVRLAGAKFRILRRGSSSRRYLHIHGNEATAREILTAHMKTHDGIAYLIESTQRNVPIGGGWLDPNRMFSREGAGKNLKRLNPDWSDSQVRSALDELDRGRDHLLRALLPPVGGLLFVLHNNSEGYSVRDEVGISDRVSLKDEAHPHEFFLCTQPADFDVLAASPYNVVLQNRVPPDDDGSLSRLAARRGVRYVNLECALGKAREQTEMLAWAEEHLP